MVMSVGVDDKQKEEGNSDVPERLREGSESEPVSCLLGVEGVPIVGATPSSCSRWFT